MNVALPPSTNTSWFLTLCMRVSEGKSLKDEDVLQHLPVGTTATFYFRDLGAQISWVTVSIARNTPEKGTRHAVAQTVLTI